MSDRNVKPIKKLPKVNYGYGVGGDIGTPTYDPTPTAAPGPWKTGYVPSNQNLWQQAATANLGNAGAVYTPNAPPLSAGAMGRADEMGMGGLNPPANQSTQFVNNPNTPLHQPNSHVNGPAGGGGGGGNGNIPAWIIAAQNAGIDPQRVVNIYMNPNDPHAATDPHRAIADAVADDIWGNAATAAFGRPPTQNEWVEHYYAKNYGSRDPLEGHPASVQLIQQAANDMSSNNQNAGQQQALDDLKRAGLI